MNAIGKHLFSAPINCPWEHPYPMANGTACCQNANKTNNLTLGVACDGGPVAASDPAICCAQNAVIACPNNVSFGGVCTYSKC